MELNEDERLPLFIQRAVKQSGNEVADHIKREGYRKERNRPGTGTAVVSMPIGGTPFDDNDNDDCKYIYIFQKPAL